jgi:drug/metabolite transporter (DMT)-like permease
MIETSSGTWRTGRPFRVLVLLLGIALLIVYGAMFVVVGVNLPDSWIGLIYVIIGLIGAFTSFLYFLNPRPILLIPVSAALILIATILLGTLLFGNKIDEALQVHRLRDAK